MSLFGPTQSDLSYDFSYLHDMICNMLRVRYEKSHRVYGASLGSYSLSVGRDLYRATPAVTRDLGFRVLTRRTAPFIRVYTTILRYRGRIPARIITSNNHTNKR